MEEMCKRSDARIEHMRQRGEAMLLELQTKVDKEVPIAPSLDPTAEGTGAKKSSECEQPRADVGGNRGGISDPQYRAYCEMDYPSFEFLLQRKLDYY